MNRWTVALPVFALLFLSAAIVFSQAKPVPAGTYLTVQDVEKITGLSGIKIVPPDPSKGAGGDINFADKNGGLILMVQRMLFSDALYAQNKKIKNAVQTDLEGVGDAAFSGPAGTLQYFISFKKGKGSGSVATFLGLTGAKLPLDQVKKIAQFIASGM